MVELALMTEQIFDLSPIDPEHRKNVLRAWYGDFSRTGHLTGDLLGQELCAELPSIGLRETAVSLYNRVARMINYF